MSGKQNTSEASVTRFELKANNAVWELIIGKIFRGEKGEKGEKGEDGEAGRTPVKGVDYWTPEDAAAIEAAKKAATDAAARADAAAQQATDKVDKAVAGIQIDLDSKQDKLSTENPVQTEQIADNAVSASKLSAEVATAIGKIPQLEESVSVNNTSIENLGADVQELRENMQEKQDTLSAENPVQTEQIADGSITLKKLGADVATRFVEYLPTINDFDEVVGSDVGWKKEDMQRAAQIYASGRVGVSIYDAGGHLPMVLTSADDELEKIGSCSATLEYYSVSTDGLVVSIYIKLEYTESTGKVICTEFSNKGGVLIRTTKLSYPENWEEGEGVLGWTSDDFQECANSLGFNMNEKHYQQILIDDKLFIPVAYQDETEEEPELIALACIEGTGGGIQHTTVNIYRQGESITWGKMSSHIVTCNIVHLDKSYHELIGINYPLSDFYDAFGASASMLQPSGGSLTITGPWYDAEQLSVMTAVSSKQTSGTSFETTFTDGVHVITACVEMDGEGMVTITSKSLLTEGSAPTMVQYNALNDKIGNIDTVLTSIIGE